MGSKNLIPGQRSVARRRGNVEYIPTVEWREVSIPHWATESDQFVLSEIYGDSLSGIGICDGDFVLIYLTNSVSEGDLIAATTPDGFLVKFLSYTPDGNVRLSGTDHVPRVFPVKSVKIEGRVVRKEAA